MKYILVLWTFYGPGIVGLADDLTTCQKAGIIHYEIDGLAWLCIPYGQDYPLTLEDLSYDNQTDTTT